MNMFKKWAQREYSKKQRLITVILGGFIFWIVIPFLIVIGSSYIDPWLHLPKLYYRRINPIIGLLFILGGWLFAFIAAPAFMVKWVLGEFGSVILEGQRVIPRRLLENGFVFQYPDIEKALQNIVGE